jgi:hypothetical protein
VAERQVVASAGEALQFAADLGAAPLQVVAASQEVGGLLDELTYNVSLLLVLLRKRLVEFETIGGEGKLVLSRDQIVEMLRVFLAESTNEARVLDRVDHTVKQVADLGFVRPLRRQQHHWEVRRVIKAYVDAQILSDFAGKLREYADVASGDSADD